MHSISRRGFVMAGLASALVPVRSWADGFPERPVTIICPYAAGGSGYVVLRLMQPEMEKAFGQSVIIEARPGGGGNIGAMAVLHSKPTGYTLLMGATNNFVINQFLFRNLSYDPLKDFSLIARPTIIPSVFYTNSSVPVHNLQEFIAYAKAHPGKLNYASPGVGTTPHLAVERLKQITGINLVHIPFGGAPPAMQALLSNNVQLYLAGYGVGRAYTKGGKIRMLAVASEQRLPVISNIPTVIESGIPGYTASNWWGVAAPKGTPAARLDRVYKAVMQAVDSKAFVDRVKGLGFLPGHETSSQFAASAKAEAKVWKETIERGHLSIR